MFSPMPLFIYYGFKKPFDVTLAGAPLLASGFDFFAWVKQQRSELSKR